MTLVESTVARLRDATVVLDDRPVLRHLDLDLMPGITLLRGPNGAGKTTALRALAGLVPLARGTREVPADVLYLGHRPQLLHGLTARENLRFFREFRGPTSWGRLRARVDGPPAGRDPDPSLSHVLEAWGIAADADRPVERLSTGQRRRASLARLMTEGCDLVLLDEPFAELDADAGATLSRELDALPPFVAVLVATHGHAELDERATRVVELRDGRVLA